MEFSLLESLFRFHYSDSILCDLVESLSEGSITFLLPLIGPEINQIYSVFVSEISGNNLCIFEAISLVEFGGRSHHSNVM